MKKPSFALLLFVTVALLAACGGKKGGETFTSKEGKFSVEFKAKPKQDKQEVPTVAGTIAMYTFIHEEGASKASMVAYCDYPADILSQANAVDLLHSSKEGVVQKFSGTIKDEKVSKFQGYDAIDFTATGPSMSTAYKLVLAGNRLYQVGILKEGGPVEQADIDGFIGTFKIVP